MGWCQEFGLHIVDGCDHAMIAGRDSCSCPDCGTVCQGRFSGCEIVWRAGPVAIPAPTAIRALTSGPLPVAVPGRPMATNGKSATIKSSRPASSGPRGAAAAPMPLPVPVPLSLATGSTAAATPSPAHDTGAGEIELRQLCADLKAEVQRLSLTVERLSDEGQRSLREEVLREVDARFAWLTNQLSDRLVTLGNEVAAVKRHLEPDQVQAS